MKEYIRDWAAGSVIVRWILPLTNKFLLWLINMVHRLKYTSWKEYIVNILQRKTLTANKESCGFIHCYTCTGDLPAARSSDDTRAMPCSIIIWNVWKPDPKAIDLADCNLDPGLMAVIRATRALFVNRHSIPLIVIYRPKLHQLVLLQLGILGFW